MKQTVVTRKGIKKVTSTESVSLSSERVLLKEQAYVELKRLIQSGEFPPHMALSERQLSERMGMSKTPIRAALEKLESQGLVTVSPQRGIFVRELSAREIGELFDVRMAVEPFATSKLATRSWSISQRAALKRNLARQKVAAKADDPLAATELDIRFHRLLAEVLDNREIMVWLEKCFDKLHRSVLHINRQVPGRLQKSYEDHVAIANAILDSDESKSRSLMQEHLKYGRRFLLEQ
jgi:DNA-binding GntR family transcriptional regulator